MPSSALSPPLPTPPSPASLPRNVCANVKAFCRESVSPSGTSRASTPVLQLVWELPQRCVPVGRVRWRMLRLGETEDHVVGKWTGWERIFSSTSYHGIRHALGLTEGRRPSHLDARARLIFAPLRTMSVRSVVHRPRYVPLIRFDASSGSSFSRLPAHCACCRPCASLFLHIHYATHLLALLPPSLEALCSPLVSAATFILAPCLVFCSALLHPVSCWTSRSPSTFTIVSQRQQQATRRPCAQRSPRKSLGAGRLRGGLWWLSACAARERTQRSSHEAWCHPVGARVTQDRETRGVRAPFVVVFGYGSGDEVS
ncbi:hypothetical protein DFH08DRAFT_977608 [Mycena albidolilacea]|uniref:Uncharacterized protein n=1 Tax=Mycena albidolilacea TaxID=1033008 RepID=A0AAD6Z0H8_9AGAR|nr:hypothetical protein DFH08DRAFT_977608 [Mycena albidolilacea]